MQPLAAAMSAAAAAVRPCSVCGNLDTTDPCAICRDPARDPAALCVVEDVADLWALERTGAFRGRYHVLGGTLSALDGVGPEELNIARLIARLRPDAELILALNATVDGQTTAHYWPTAPPRPARDHAARARRAGRRRTRLSRRGHAEGGAQGPPRDLTFLFALEPLRHSAVHRRLRLS